MAVSAGSRLARVALYLLYLLVVAELGSRAFWRIEHGVPLLSSQPVDWYAVYFQGFRDSRLNDAPPEHGGEALDVLLLGGSVLHNLYHDRGGELERRFSRAAARPVRLYSFAMRAHTTRDSALKYRLLAGHGFDLIVLYHGINDARLNNAPPELFRADYSHAAWYDEIGQMLRVQPWRRGPLLPYTLGYAWMSFTEIRAFGRYVPRHRPNHAWTRYGGEIRTAGPFRANLLEIIDEAGRRGEAVLLMTFAWHQPDDYSLERFEAKQLDYAEHRHATEIWGEPEHVARALEAHNRVIRALPATPHVLVLDVERAIPKRGEYFDDICHLTRGGERLWMDAMATAVSELAGPAPERGTFGGR